MARLSFRPTACQPLTRPAAILLQLALLACLALLGAGAAAAQAEPCSAEKECVASSCGGAYAQPAASFPYTVAYTTTGDSLATTFHFKVRTELQPRSGVQPRTELQPSKQ